MNQHCNRSNAAGDDIHRNDKERISESDQNSPKKDQKQILDDLSRRFIREFAFDDLPLLLRPSTYLSHEHTYYLIL